MLGVRDENTPGTFAGQMGRVRGPCCSCECATEYSVDGVIVNERLKMGSCSRGWAIERSLDGMVVNMMEVENLLFM